MRGAISLPCFSHMWQLPGPWPIPIEVVTSSCAVLCCTYVCIDGWITAVCVWGGGEIVHHGVGVHV